MKAYTDIEQSKKLAEILPIETANMRYDEYISYIDGTPKVGYKKGVADGIPCWSLAALLKVIRKSVGYELLCNGTSITIKCELGDNPWSIEINKDNELDACVEMIIKLHEQKLL